MGRLKINYEKRFSAYPLKEEDLYEGMTFGYFENISQNITHLYIVLTEPEEHGGKVVVATASVTSMSSSQLSGRKKKVDETVVLNKGDHPAISHPSFVFYKRAKLWSVDELLIYLNDEQALCKDAMNEKVLEKIQYGLLSSDNTPEEVREFSEQYFYGSE